MIRKEPRNAGERMTAGDPSPAGDESFARATCVFELSIRDSDAEGTRREWTDCPITWTIGNRSNPGFELNEGRHDLLLDGGRVANLNG